MILLDSLVKVTPKDGSEPYMGTAASVSPGHVTVRPSTGGKVQRITDLSTVEQLDPPPGSDATIDEVAEQLQATTSH